MASLSSLNNGFDSLLDSQFMSISNNNTNSYVNHTPVQHEQQKKQDVIPPSSNTLQSTPIQQPTVSKQVYYKPVVSVQQPKVAMGSSLAG